MIFVFTVCHNHGNPIIYNIHKKLELCLELKMLTYQKEQGLQHSPVSIVDNFCSLQQHE